VTEPLVVVVGDVMNDVIVRPLAPLAPATDTPSRIAWSPGGSGANQAAWLGSLGIAVRFVARAGKDDAAEHRAALARWGVDARLSEDPDRPTGTVVALVGDDGERSMFTDRGANVPTGLPDLPPELLDGAQLLHVSGYQLFGEPARRALGPLLEAALDAGVPLSVDPASVAGLRQVGGEQFFALTEGATVLLPNLDEGRLLTGLHDPDAIVERLHSRYAVVALKLGAAGALAVGAGNEVVRMPATPARVVDSTGAGDAFCAGFLARWVGGAPLERCLAGAVSCAGRAVAQLGARPAAPDGR
jgi:sugar/nucleoside kinase (ribokinase family)